MEEKNGGWSFGRAMNYGWKKETLQTWSTLQEVLYHARESMLCPGSSPVGHCHYWHDTEFQ